MKFLVLVFSVLVFGWGSSGNAQAVSQLRFDTNVEPQLKSQMNADLVFLQSIRSSGSPSRLHQEVFGQVNGAIYSKWLMSRVFQVGKNLCGSSTAVACVIPGFDNKIWITPNYTKFDHPQIARLSVILHEARHTEKHNGYWSHATCPVPFKDESGRDVTSIWTGSQLAGKEACDVFYQGSYGSQTIFLKNIAAKCINCNSKVRADAELFGNDQLKRIIDPQTKQKMLADFGMKTRISQK